MTRTATSLARRIALGSAVALIAALPVAGLAAAPLGASTRAPALRLVAPAHVVAGQLITLHVVVDGAHSLGALQANLRFDGRALDVGRVVLRSPLAGTGPVTALSAVETPNRKVIAGFSCVAPACAVSNATTADGSSVATIDVEVLRPGRVEVRLDGGLLVDRSGAVIAHTGASSVVLDVAGSSHVWRAPHGPELAARTHRRGDSPDLTRDGRVTFADAMGMERSFLRGADDDVACAAPEAGTDVNGDGCITIADLQTASARATATTTAVLAASPPVTFTVNSNADGGDVAADGICQTSVAGQCTLRAAIQEANRATGPATIAFNIAGAGIHTITPATTLPQLNDVNGGITIDGFTEPGSVPNSDPLADNAVYGIELKGTGESRIDGLFMASASNTIRGLVMDNWRRAIWINGGSTNTVVGNMIGLTPSGGLIPGFAYVPQSSCIVLQGGAQSNQIGAAGAANRNVVSGCGHIGIATYEWPTKNNNIQNNITGLDPTGTQARGSKSHGIDINTGTQFTMIGGTDPLLRNVSSGNVQEGIEISHNPLTQHNSIIGNFVGTDLTGNNAPAYAKNLTIGIRLEGNPDCNNQPCPGDEGFMTITDNVIANNGKGGILIDKGVHDSVVARNKIGVTANGAAAGNGGFGVMIQAGAVRITVGPANEIANNTSGIQLMALGTSPANSAETLTDQDTFTQNSIHNNGVNGVAALGIDLAPFGAVNTAANSDANVNDAMLAPVLSSPTKTTINAQTCASCVVELFLSDQGAGAIGSGVTYLSSASADSTGFAQVTVPASALGHAVTATATNTAGSTSEFARNVNIPSSNPNNIPPVARFTGSCNGLLCSFDGTTSSDADGTVVGYAWDFGDGSTATGSTTNHAYATAGTFTVTLTVTDNDGGTNAVSHSASPQSNGTVALDTFSRSTASGWGTADLGGAYTLQGTAADFTTASGRGNMTIHTAASGHAATLLGTSVLNTDEVVDTGTSLAPAGGTWGQVSYLTARRTAANTEYRLRLRFPPTGGVKLSIVKVVGNTTEVQIGNEVTVAGLSYTANQAYTIRFRVTGTNPTTLAGKVWLAGTTEPASFNLTVTDTTAQLQAAGSDGVRTFLGGSSTNTPVFFFDNLSVTDLG